MEGCNFHNYDISDLSVEIEHQLESPIPVGMFADDWVTLQAFSPDVPCAESKLESSLYSFNIKTSTCVPFAGAYVRFEPVGSGKILCLLSEH